MVFLKINILADFCRNLLPYLPTAYPTITVTHLPNPSYPYPALLPPAARPLAYPYDPLRRTRGGGASPSPWMDITLCSKFLVGTKALFWSHKQIDSTLIGPVLLVAEKCRTWDVLGEVPEFRHLQIGFHRIPPRPGFFPSPLTVVFRHLLYFHISF